MSALFRQHSRAQALVVALVLVGAAGYAVARMAPNTTRTIPYQGVLEQNGAVANGDYLMRFGLFVSSPDANAAQCVADDNCALWSEEQLVTVTNGRFSVLLGDSDADLTDQLLANNTLHLVMAVKPAADPGVFTLLDGAQEIVPQPWAARAAGAQDFRVRGALAVDGAATIGSVSTPSLSTSSLAVTGPSSLTGNVNISGGTLILNSNSIAQVNAIGAQTLNTANLNVSNGLPITLSAEYADNAGGAPIYRTLTSTTRSACFLVRHNGTSCTVYASGATWAMETWNNSSCRARCISW